VYSIILKLTVPSDIEGAVENAVQSVIPQETKAKLIFFLLLVLEYIFYHESRKSDVSKLQSILKVTHLLLKFENSIL
jgi:hypothetical protein